MSSMDMNYASGWKPDEGDTLIGTVVSIDFGWSNYTNAEYPIVTVQPEGTDKPDARVAVHCFHTALLNRIMSLRPTEGERIGIQYKGKEPSKDNPRNTVAKYVVRLDRKGDPWAGRARPEQQARPAQAPPESDIPASAEDFTDARPASPGDDDIPF